MILSQCSWINRLTGYGMDDRHSIRNVPFATASNGYQSMRGRIVELTPHLHVVPIRGMRGALTPFSCTDAFAFIAWRLSIGTTVGVLSMQSPYLVDRKRLTGAGCRSILEQRASPTERSIDRWYPLSQYSAAVCLVVQPQMLFYLRSK
jgi:hypothetical protein